MPIPEFGGTVLDEGATLAEVIDHVAMLQKTIEYHLTGKLDTANAREFGGWYIGEDTIASESLNVGMFSGDTGSGVDDIRLWAGSTARDTAAFRVYESGHLFASDANLSGNITMTGGSISWGSVPAPSPSDVGALPSDSPMLTYIGPNGIYTGTLTAGQINAVDGIILGANADILWDNLASPLAYGDIAGSKPPTDANNTFSELLFNSGIRGFVNQGGTLFLSADYVTAGVLTGRTVRTAASGSRVLLTSGFADAHFYNSFGSWQVFDTGGSAFQVGSIDLDTIFIGSFTFSDDVHFAGETTGITARFG